MASFTEGLQAGEAAPLPQRRAESLEMQIPELGIPGCDSHSSKEVLLRGNAAVLAGRGFGFHGLGWLCPSFISCLVFELVLNCFGAGFGCFFFIFIKFFIFIFL